MWETVNRQTKLNLSVSGASLRQQLEKMLEVYEEQFFTDDDGVERNIAEYLAEPEIPYVAHTAAKAFGKLSLRRTQGIGGPNAITYSEVESFMRCTGTILDPFDVKLVMTMDDAYLNAVVTLLEKSKNV